MYKVGVAGVGALGSIVCTALSKGIEGLELTCVSNLEKTRFDVPHVDFETLVDDVDIVVECLPPKAVPELAIQALDKGKILICISSSALLLYPKILAKADTLKEGRLIIPSGALSGLDAVTALKQGGITDVTIRTTKPPRGLKGAPYIEENEIDLDGIQTKTLIFSGNALDAAKAFPANVNVAATLSWAGLGPEWTQVEVWADPDIKGNAHEITVKGGSSTIVSRVENTPDPSNPKSSMLAGYSIVSVLHKLVDKVSVL